MKGLFKQKPRPPVEVMRQMQELLIEVDKHWNSRDPKRGEKMVELSKLLRELTAILFGTGNMVPTSETCVQLAVEFFKENTMRLVIFYLPKLNSEACRDAALIVSRLQREQVDSRFISTDYLEANKDLMDHLISGFADLDLSLHFGAILRDCIRLQSMARYIIWPRDCIIIIIVLLCRGPQGYVLESDGMKKFFEYLQIPNFDIASDAFATFKELITRHKSTVADFLSKRYDWFFTEFNSHLLESKNYMTKRQATRLLAVVLMERSNAGTMIRYVSSKDNLRLIMNLLRETSKTIQVEAFHIFKNKPQEIIAILVANKAKFLRLLAALKTEKEDEMFEEDKQLVMKEIECLESRYRS